jgi:hypothetical protein
MSATETGVAPEIDPGMAVLGGVLGGVFFRGEVFFGGEVFLAGLEGF